MSLTPVQIWPDSSYHDNVQLPIYRIYVARFSGLEPFHHLPEHARRGRPIPLPKTTCHKWRLGNSASSLGALLAIGQATVILRCCQVHTGLTDTPSSLLDKA